MEKVKKFVKSDKAKWIATLVAGVLLAGGLIGLGVRVSKQETTKTLGTSSFGIGLLDDTTGALPDEVDKGGMYTKAYHKYEGLDVELDKDAPITYQVNYYDASKEFVGVLTFTADYNVAVEATEATTAGFDVTKAKYVKIEVIPTEDDDGTVSWLEKMSYLNQVTVTVAK